MPAAAPPRPATRFAPRTIVARYLEQVTRSRPRGRPVTPEALVARIDAIEVRLGNERSAIARLALVQERLDLQQRIAEFSPPADGQDWEAEFIAIAAAFGEGRKQPISYAAWRAVGVPASVLKKANIPRTRLVSANGG